MDVVASCAESRDQRRGREKMRARGGGGGGGGRRESGRKRVHFSEDHKTLAETGAPNKMKVTVFQLGGQQRSVS